MTIAIVSAGRIRVARNSIQLPALWVKDILAEATENVHYAVYDYQETLYRCLYSSDLAVIRRRVNILIKVAGDVLPKARTESKTSKKTPGAEPRRSFNATQVFVV